jgi:hypothetical protein
MPKSKGPDFRSLLKMNLEQIAMMYEIYDTTTARENIAPTACSPANEKRPKSKANPHAAHTVLTGVFV